MARNTGPVCRLCRREGVKLFLKGSRCNGEKCGITRRDFAPGQHGQARKKESNYGIQLREKQKVRRIYGVLEHQFRIYFKTAAKSKGVTGKVLLQLLERRLDNVIFRLGLGLSRPQARQIVRHNMVSVNAVRVNVPSFLVSAGDLIVIIAKDKAKNKLKENLENAKDRTVPGWLEFKAAEMKATVVRLPEKTDIGQPIEEALIVEYYSK